MTQDPSSASPATRFRVGVFTLLGVALLGAISVFVNDRPFWWRECKLEHITLEDATGLKSKSPIRSLGLQIGYIRSIELSETSVRIGVCITAPVDILPETKAFVKGEGFLGDKFLELKPVRNRGMKGGTGAAAGLREAAAFVVGLLSADAHAAPAQSTARRRGDIPVGEKSQDVQQLVDEVDGLVGEMKNLTSNLKESFDPAEMKATLTRLNKTLENASRTLSPEGSLTTTAQRTLAKLEDAIEQLRDMATRVNRGEGSVGMLINDPAYAEDIREAIRNINRFLGKASGVRFNVNMGIAQIPARGNGTRAWLHLGLWPESTRYYLLGLVYDPRGLRSTVTTTTTAGGQSYQTETVQTSNSMLFTAMAGKVLWRRVDLSAGLLYGDGAVRVGLNLGPHDREEMLALHNDAFSAVGGGTLDYRGTVVFRPFVRRSELFANLQFVGGLDSVRRVGGQLPLFFGGGVTFDDEDIKMLFAFL